MKKTSNIFLVVAALVPVVLLFWPFAEWDGVMSVVLRVIPALAVQILLCRVGRLSFVKAIPALLTGAFAAWGTYLYFTSSHWSNATIGDLVTDYISPVICCIVVWGIYLLKKEKK